MAVISSVLQSNAQFFANDDLQIQVDCVRPPAAYGSKVDGKCVNFDQFSVEKNSIFVINNKDNRSLKKFKGQRGEQLLNEMVTDLCRRAEIDLSDGAHYGHITNFQTYLNDYTIVIYNSRDGSSVYFESPKAPGKNCLNLIMENQHFNIILSLTGVFATS